MSWHGSAPNAEQYEQAMTELKMCIRDRVMQARVPESALCPAGSACLAWAVVQYWTYFQSFVADLLPLWVLAALAIPTRRRGEELEWTYDVSPSTAARRGSRPFRDSLFAAGGMGRHGA